MYVCMYVYMYVICIHLCMYVRKYGHCGDCLLFDMYGERVIFCTCRLRRHGRIREILFAFLFLMKWKKPYVWFCIIYIRTSGRLLCAILYWDQRFRIRMYMHYSVWICFVIVNALNVNLAMVTDKTVYTYTVYVHLYPRIYYNILCTALFGSRPYASFIYYNIIIILWSRNLRWLTHCYHDEMC